MTKNGVESENEFDVDEPEEVKKEVLKPQTNSRRQSARVRVSRVPVVVDTGSTDDDLSGEDSDFERLVPRKRMRGSSSTGGGGGGGRRSGGRSKGRGAASKGARVSSSTTNGGADIEGGGSEDNSNAVSGSDTEPTSTTLSHSATFQSGSFVVSKKDFEKLAEPPLWKIDGKALLQKYIPFQQEGKTFYKNTSVYSGWSTSTKQKYYPCTVVFKKQSKRENILEFLKEKVVKDENYVCSESEAEGDVEDDDEERNDEEEFANGVKNAKKNKDSFDDDDQEEEEEEEEDEEEEGGHDDDDDDDDNGVKENEEGKGAKEDNEEDKGSDEKPKE